MVAREQREQGGVVAREQRNRQLNSQVTETDMSSKGSLGASGGSSGCFLLLKVLFIGHLNRQGVSLGFEICGTGNRGGVVPYT